MRNCSSVRKKSNIYFRKVVRQPSLLFLRYWALHLKQNQQPFWFVSQPFHLISEFMIHLTSYVRFNRWILLIELRGTEFNRRINLSRGLGPFDRGLVLIGFRGNGTKTVRINFLTISLWTQDFYEAMRFLVDETEGPINYHLRPQRNWKGVCHWCSYQILTSYLISVYMNRRAETWKTWNLTVLCTKETKSSTNDVICVCRLTDHEVEPINCENNMTYYLTDNWNGLFILTMCDVYLTIRLRARVVLLFSV